MGGDPRKINPLAPVDLVIDHSVMVDFFASSAAFRQNVNIEYDRNGERYTFLKWGQRAFDNPSASCRPAPASATRSISNISPATVWTREEVVADGTSIEVAFPDTLVGTDSHTTMVNGLAVLGWGVGGIEAEAAMLGQPISMLIPEVVGFSSPASSAKAPPPPTSCSPSPRCCAAGVVGKFVEFFGDGSSAMSVEDVATIANMAPEYGATCGFFPVSEETLLTSKAPAGLPSFWRWSRLMPGPGHVPRPGHAGSDFHRHARARPRRGRAVDGRPEAAAGPRQPQPRRPRFRQGHG